MWTCYENNDIEFLFQVVKCTHNFYWNRPKKGLLSPDIWTLISYLFSNNPYTIEYNSNWVKLRFKKITSDYPSKSYALSKKLYLCVK